MNFNVYLDTPLGEALKRLARRKKVARNTLLRQAVQDLLTKESASENWSPRVLEWQGDPDFEPFEAHRTKLRAPSQDPLA